jgi:hypothetical protein
MELLPFQIKGQITIIFTCIDITEDCVLYLYDKLHEKGLKIVISTKNVEIYNINTNEKYIDDNCNSGLSNILGIYYWLSIDAQNQTIRLGVGEPRLETCIYNYKQGKQDNQDKQYKSFLESIVYISINDRIKVIKKLRDPITDNIALLVKNTNDITMNDIAKGIYMPKANLSLICQKLYDCISGEKFVLDDDEFSDFSKAIEYSIATPGMWCNKTLENKSREFNKDKPNILETYLRITLGSNNGESPGIPYVMEIWPIGHYSPIHNHANGNAVIRVLHGNIHVKLFAFLCTDKDGILPFAEKDFYKDDITWISPTLNQTHQLVNLDTNNSTCITIQCYMYDENNNTHYDYFDYIDDNGSKQQYEPDSDMDFVSFKELIKNEWMSK